MIATAAVMVAAVIVVVDIALLRSLSCMSIHILTPRQKGLFPSLSIASVVNVYMYRWTILGQITSGDGGGG